MSKFSKIRQVDPISEPDISRIMKFITSDSPSIKNLRTDQMVVSYDRRSQKASYYKTASTFMKLISRKESFELYFLDAYEKLTVIQTSRFSSNNFRTVELQVRYVISILKGSELQLVEALAKRDVPSKLLHDYFTKWMNEALATSTDLAYENFDGFIEKIANSLKAEGKRIGLSFTIDITHSFPGYTGNTLDQSITLIEENVRIQPSEFNEFLTLGFDAVIIPEDPSHTSITDQLALIDTSQLKALLIKWMQSFIRASVTYNDLAEGLQNRVRSNLIAYWNDQLKQTKKGWKIGDVKLSSLQGSPIQFHRESLEIIVMLKNAEVRLIYTVVLYLENAESFMNARIGDLEVWIKEKLHKVAQHRLANVLYAEFLSQFDVYGENIKQELNLETRKIGYRVDILLTSEVVNSSMLQVDFEFTEEEQIFETSLNDKVKLKAVISGRIASLDHETWKRILTPSTLGNIVKDIKTDVHRETRNKILSVPPEDFYVKFNTDVPGEIKEKIRSLLVEKYNVHPDVDIHVAIEHSLLKDRLSRLSMSSLYTDVNLFSDRVRLQIKFCVQGVDRDKWELFANKKYVDIEDEKNSLIEDVRYFFVKKLTHIPVIQTLKNLDQICKDFYEECISDIKVKRFVTIYIENTHILDHPLITMITTASLDNLEKRIESFIARRNECWDEMNKAKSANNLRLVEQIQKELDELSDQLNAIIPEQDTKPKQLSNT